MSDNDDTGEKVRAIDNRERADAADELARHAAAPTEVTKPNAPDELADAATQAVDEGVDTVAAVGGDGTQRTVAEAIAGSATDLAVVPGGTVNLLARILGVETIADAAEVIDHGDVRSLDLAQANNQSFLLNSSSGYDAGVIAATNDRAKRFGRAGYTAVGLAKLATSKPGQCRVTVDDQPFFDGSALTVLVLNVGQRGSSSFKIAPDAEPDDGLLDAVVIRGRRRSLVRSLYARLRNRRPDPADAVFAQGETITVRWKDEVPVQCDGDAIGTMAEIGYTIEPGAVRVRTLN
jgi:YegS/Rv2252/BmrU family lipid kinase